METEPAASGKCPVEVTTSRKLHRVGPGEPPALAEVYRDHADFVYRTASHLGVPAAEVEDVMHDVFLVVHRRLPDYDGRAELRSWLYGITKRVVMHHRRTHARRMRRLAAVPAPTPDAAIDEQVERVRAAEVIDSFLVGLDQPSRVVFALADIEGLTGPEIATAEGIKLNTVYSRLRAARHKLRRFLATWRKSDGGSHGG